jgi:hypothetical protein
VWDELGRLARDSAPYERLTYTRNRRVDSQVAPASFETRTESAPMLATPTKIRGVADPAVPDVESNVTQEIPTISLL